MLHVCNILHIACLASLTLAQSPGSISGPPTPGTVSGGGPGTVSGGGGSSGGSSPGGMGPAIGPNPFLQMGPHAPNAIHHVGISYNLLKGNPDGEYWSTGGEDPGVSLTRKIFTISGGDNPPEAIIEHHDGCQYSHGFSLFYNTKSYQDKLYINVKTSGAADDALKPYGFTLSSAFQAVAQQTGHHHYVFQDATTYCKIGHVRYSMNLAGTDHYPVNREFAMDVCKLPTTYNANAYMQFIENWGTHVMTEVTIGKLTTYRYMGKLRSLFNFVVANVTDEIKPGGPMNGFPESYVIDLDSFKYRHEYKYIVGVYEDMLSVGDMYYNDVIGKTLETIDTALDAKYWQYMSGYVAQNICAPGSNAHLSTWQANIIQALKAYPSYKKAVLPAVQPLAMPMTWPYGTYSLLKPSTGCPQNFVEGQVTIPQSSHSGSAPTSLNIDGSLSTNTYELHFCTKDNPSPTDYDIQWPKGDYCITKYDHCPAQFRESYVQFYSSSAINATGILPTAHSYSASSLYVYFCCRNDGVYSTAMYMPTSKPFYLYRFSHGCQTVAGMTVQDQILGFYSPLFPDPAYGGYYTPYIKQTVVGPNGFKRYDLHACYYTVIT